ncbi:hypothetical protein F4775DRAFT_559814 [Biscogniauxia sp. FL1348]|nr:hypothetical protein F4775DRAFT_559814 [Biscogniauxia sp. FL1348]
MISCLNFFSNSGVFPFLFARTLTASLCLPRYFFLTNQCTRGVSDVLADNYLEPPQIRGEEMGTNLAVSNDKHKTNHSICNTAGMCASVGFSRKRLSQT